MDLTNDFIRRNVADSDVIFQRGQRIYRHGAHVLKEADPGEHRFVYAMDDNYGDYTVSLALAPDTVNTACDCPYPGTGSIRTRWPPAICKACCRC
jgi:hypothetical protein